MAYRSEHDGRRNEFMAVAEQVKSQFPEAWRTSGSTTEYVERVVDTCRKTLAGGPSIYYCNGKRGNSHDISRDIVAFPNASGAASPDGGGVELHDFIVAHDSPDAHIGWGDVTQDTITGAANAGIRTPAVLVVPRSFSDTGGGTPTTGNWKAAHSALLARLPSTADTRMIAEQFAFSFPSEGWAQKRASILRPISANTIARTLAGGNKEAYLVIPRPSGTPTTYGPSEMNSQILVPVTPRDHVGGVIVPPPVDPPVTPPATPPVKTYVGDDRANQLSDMMDRDYRRGGHLGGLNAGAGQWFGQIYHDYYAGMEWDASVAKHRAVWCAILGISPN